MKLEELMRQHAKTINGESSENLPAFIKTKRDFEFKQSKRRKSNKYRTVISVLIITLSLCLIGIMPLNAQNASSTTDDFYANGGFNNEYFDNQRITYETKADWMQDNFNTNLIVPEHAKYIKMNYKTKVCEENFLMLEYRIFKISEGEEFYFLKANLFADEQNFEKFTNFSKVKAMKSSKNYISPTGISITLLQISNKIENKAFTFIFFNFASIFYQINLETGDEDFLNYIINLYNL